MQKNHVAKGVSNPKGFITPWWVSVEDRDDQVGLVGVLKFARDLKVDPSDYMRVIAAVNPDWDNALDMVLQAKLKTDVYGYWGGAAPQANGLKSWYEINRGGAVSKLPGTVYQLWIPNLTNENIEFVSIDTPQ